MSSTMMIWIGIAIVAIVIVSQVAKYPGQIFWKLVKSAIVGCLFLFAVNWVGQYFHFHLPFNPLTALTAGFLGIPGVAALIAVKLWMF